MSWWQDLLHLRSAGIKRSTYPKRSMRDLSEDEQRWAGVLGILSRHWGSRERMNYADVERQNLGTVGPYSLVQSAFNTTVNELLRAKLLDCTVGPGEWEIQQMWLTDAGREWLAARSE